MPLIDLSHTVETGMPVYPGDPAVRLRPAEAAPPWRVTTLELGSHTGTHIDAPSHYFAEGAGIDAYPLERFILECVVVDVRDASGQGLVWADIAPAMPPEPAGRGVLLYTGWDRHWGGPEAYDHPFLTVEAGRELAALGVGLVGTDAFNIEATDGPDAGVGDPEPDDAVSGVHRVLLGADVLIVENLTDLGALPTGRLLPCAFVPLKLGGCDGSPIRAYAWV